MVWVVEEVEKVAVAGENVNEVVGEVIKGTVVVVVE